MLRLWNYLDAINLGDGDDERYRRFCDGRARGMITAVSPTLGDIHQVENAYDDRVSIGIHVYGADIGMVDREVFTPDGEARPFRSGYANA